MPVILTAKDQASADKINKVLDDIAGIPKDNRGTPHRVLSLGQAMLVKVTGELGLGAAYTGVEWLPPTVDVDALLATGLTITEEMTGVAGRPVKIMNSAEINQFYHGLTYFATTLPRIFIAYVRQIKSDGTIWVLIPGFAFQSCVTSPE